MQDLDRRKSCVILLCIFPYLLLNAFRNEIMKSFMEFSSSTYAWIIVFESTRTELFFWAKINLIWICNLPYSKSCMEVRKLFQIYLDAVFFSFLDNGYLFQKFQRKGKKIFLLSRWLIMKAEKYLWHRFTPCYIRVRILYFGEKFPRKLFF